MLGMKSGNRARVRRMVCGSAIALMVFGNAAGALAVGQSGDAALEAKVVNGQVYVKASSLVSQLGGQGVYDAKSQTYQYKAGNSVPSIVKKLSPSVVAIIGKVSEGEVDTSDRYNLAHGTGVVLKKDGWIVTNAHVVSGLKHAVVVTSDGKSYTITKQFVDEISDIAIIQINAKNLTPAVFSPSNASVEVGESVVALGTPISFSFRNSATVGVISGLNRSVDSIYKLIQTDAAINPGNSGGPLVNMKGEVVGINSLKYSAVGVENMGFSIPTNTVQYIVNQLMQYGKVKRPTLGFDMEESWSAIVGLPTNEPLTVTRVDSDAAVNAGIKAGDVLYSINGKQVTTMLDINELFKGYMPGQTVKLMMQSGGDLVERKLQLTEQS
ncbi:trypsin-like peptidase domain-containing protein [Paenibacillus terrigena]|uniref:S1C family serine protease n=1 Tax=Paenibacillus terrigena TaxID=369333 RepID=UPI0028D8D347|nr:trypsin-like peptidase domain-containing protein [Paenibacillus terrigena]